MSSPMRMYILIREEVPAGFAVLAAAHASLACYLEHREHPDVSSWLDGPFRKVICRVGEGEWNLAREAPDHVVITESALDGQEVALAFRPRPEWPKAFRFFKLFD